MNKPVILSKLTTIKRQDTNVLEWKITQDMIRRQEMEERKEEQQEMMDKFPELDNLGGTKVHIPLKEEDYNFAYEDIMDMLKRLPDVPISHEIYKSLQVILLKAEKDITAKEKKVYENFFALGRKAFSHSINKESLN